MATPQLEHAFDIRVRVGAPRELGDTGSGVARVIPVVGGDVEGPLLTGRVVGHGSDWQTISTDGVTEIHARYLIETDDGATFDVEDRGPRHQADGTLVHRTALRLTTGDDRHRWVNRTLFLGSGERTADGLTIRVFAVR